MSVWTRNNTVFIMASKGYNRKLIENQGIKVYQPYRGNGLFTRIMRELCFRIPFLPKRIWYNTNILVEEIDFINIYDVLITKHYLQWLTRKFPGKRINYLYNNMVGKAKNLPPEKIPKEIVKWTYDDYDSRKYHIRLYNNYWIYDNLPREKQKPEYDVFFIGRDKGRGNELLALEKKLCDMRLITNFIITKNGKISRNKSYYKKEIPYEKVLDLDSRSRAILNVTMEHQEGVTLRDIESVAMGIKLITTNKNIANKDLYHPNNVFILGTDPLSTLTTFIQTKFVDKYPEIKEHHTFEAWLDEITG